VNKGSICFADGMLHLFGHGCGRSDRLDQRKNRR